MKGIVSISVVIFIKGHIDEATGVILDEKEFAQKLLKIREAGLMPQDKVRYGFP